MTFSDQGRRLRVLHVVGALGPTNGQYHEHCLPMIGERDLAICSVFPASLTPPPEIKLYEGDGSTRGFLRALRRAFEAGPYDVVHAHAAVAGAGLLLARLLRGKSMAGCVYTVQNSYSNYKFRNRLLLYPMFAAYPKIVLCSDAALRSMPAALRWLGRRKTVVVRNAVDTERARRVADAEEPAPAGDRFTVVSVGRLIRIKNQEVLIEAFAGSRGPEGSLVFVGDGPLRASLREQADRSGLNGQVAFTGLVERDDVYRHTARGDVFVSASRGEGLPVAVLEGMACARPVILSDIPPHREIAEGAGFIPLIAPDDREGFTRELRRFSTMTREQRRDIGERCRRLVEERFSLAAMHAAYVPVYADVMQRQRRGQR